jgi:DNA replication and repair protein RecF
VHLEKLQLINFKNYAALSMEFPSQVNFLLGLNGSGKTNLLDAIYYLSATKSFSNTTDSNTILHGTDFFSIKGFFRLREKRHEIVCRLQQGRKKVFQEDSIDYSRLSEHIGKYPVVLISPMDVDLVRESSEARRKFFDQMISQVDHDYLESLLTYHHVLKQRNSYLHMVAERGGMDMDMIALYDQQLIHNGLLIYERRKSFVNEFLPFFTRAYNFLVEEKEEVSLTYVSEISDQEYSTGLKNTLKRDIALERTTFGVHRDDYVFGFAHGDLKRLGSQGQQKSFLVSIKLAQVEVLKVHDGFGPVLLLDDIFDKLDDYRIARLLSVVTEKNYGQVFITDAGPERTLSLKKELAIDGQVFKVDKGSISIAN